MSSLLRSANRNELGKTRLLAVHHGDLAVLDEEGDVEYVFHRVGEARRIADKLVEVDGPLVVPLELSAKVVVK